MNIKMVLFLSIIFLISMNLVSSLSVNADYVTVYPGEEKKVNVNINNNENFDTQDISINLNLENMQFSSVGSSEKNIDDINEDDDDSVSFNIKASTNIKPGDYNIPYNIKYTNSDSDQIITQQGSFGIHVSAKTDLDFTIEVKENPIVGQQGTVSLEIINRGLGEIKSISVEIAPQGFDLLSKDKIFVGTINGDDTDSASFDILYTSVNPVLNVRVEYKDFENKDQFQDVTIPFKVYTQEEALKLGIIKKNNNMIYLGIIVIFLIAWFVYKKIRKAKKKNGKRPEN